MAYCCDFLAMDSQVQLFNNPRSQNHKSFVAIEVIPDSARADGGGKNDALDSTGRILQSIQDDGTVHTDNQQTRLPNGVATWCWCRSVRRRPITGGRCLSNDSR